MKKLLLFVTMAASLLFTQCKKEESVSSAGKTVSMTVTAGPGSKTDITDAGAITWSAGDKLYVGDGSKYIGSLTLVGDGGSATGTFTGNVTLPTDTKDGEKSFGFFYLGSKNYTEGDDALQDGTSTQATVSFASQNIYNNNGKLENVSACHVGYGSATGTVINDVVTDINVTMLSKVAIARFCFTKENSKEAYEGALTLKGDNICNKMTVNFNSTEFACEGTKGDISLTNTTTSEKYVMLVPTNATTVSQSLTFAGENVSGEATLENGIKPNKFYGMSEAIAVTLEAAAAPSYLPGDFSVSANTKVKFSKGNLYYDGSVFHFETNQWGTQPASDGQWVSNHVSHFKWSDKDNAVTGDYNYYGTLFCASNFTVDGEAGGRTLSKDEWAYLLNTRTNATNLHAWKELDSGEHKGLVILPDDTENPSTVMGGITSTADLATSGAVFLPASGYRNEMGVYDVGWGGSYWSGTPVNEYRAFGMSFGLGYAGVSYGERYCGYSVRLVR